MKKSSSDLAKRIERRKTLSSLFLGMLAVIAYDHLIEPVRESIRLKGFSLEIVLLAAVFFFTSMRFVIGNQLHLLSDELMQMDGVVWFYDFLFISFETTLFVFLAETTSVEESLLANFDFVEILILIYLFDILWIASQYLFGRLSRDWKRKKIPWEWAALNLALTMAMGIIYLINGTFYSINSLLFVALLNFAAFGLDAWYMDIYSSI